MPTERKERGSIHHFSRIYGKTNYSNPLEIYLPDDLSNTKILIIAGIHGDEPESTVLLSDTLRHLTPDELKNAVILCANPDGMARGTRANSNGVDLNRNFPASNWQSNPVYHRNNINEPQDIKLSPGSKPASEPETVALLKMIEEIDPDYIVSIHGALACVEDPNKSQLGKWLAQKTQLQLIENVGYPTPGSLGSWAEENNFDIITFELPSLSLNAIKSNYTDVLIKLLTNSLE